MNSESSQTGPQRVQKILSAHGIASRREAEKLILDGHVTVNGIQAHLGQSAEFGRDEICVNGAPILPRGELVYIMLNKPRGYVTTRSDERGRKTVMSLVEGICPGLFPVGRLDINSEGLLIFTNDGQFAQTVTHPSRGKKKTYEVRVRGDAESAVATLCGPLLIDSHIVTALAAELVYKTEDGGLLRITIGEGRNRQIRKMCVSCGLDVVMLKRISIGALKLGSLKTGNWRHLKDEEVQSLSG